jgi:molybdate transport system substrate-binding protein
VDVDARALEESAGMRLFLILVALAACQRGPRNMTVLAASDLSLVLPKLAAAFESETKIPVSFVVGSTGQLAAQIESGAEVDVFLSADAKKGARLIENGRCQAASQRAFAQGQLVVLSKEPLNDLEQLAHARIQFVALANPTHAPYGAAAQEALEHSGLWNALLPKLTYANTVKHAQWLFESGNAEAAFVARGNLTQEAVFFTVPQHLYSPLIQVALACGQRPQANEFVNYLKSDTAQGLLRQAGFLPPP